MSVKRFLDIISPGRPAFLNASWIQGIPLRSVFMIAAIWHACQGRQRRPLRILEVGSWMGSSCLTWAEALRLFNGGQGEVVCVDPLVPYFDADEMKAALANPDAAVQRSQEELLGEMDALLHEDFVYDILMHNVSTVPPPTTVTVIREFSDKALAALPDSSFDFVYLDGSHFYDHVVQDIRHAKRLVKDGGFICGDDLELEIHQIDLGFAVANKAKDFPTDPRTGTQFHPGVTLAVGEMFGVVANYFGFWLVERKATSFAPVPFQHQFPIGLPSHFPPAMCEMVMGQLRQLGLLKEHGGAWKG